MTDCRRQLTFSFYQHKQLVADFKGGQISSGTGLLAVRELDQKLGWLAEAAWMEPPAGPGLGVELDAEKLARWAVPDSDALMLKDLS